MRHDPLKFASELGAKLAARSRHVCMFLGAGVSQSCGLPNVGQLQAKVLAALGEPDRANFEKQLSGRNLEQALTRLRRIATLLDGTDTVNGLTAKSAADLDVKVCRAIVKELDTKPDSLKPVIDFAAWVARADYHSPVEIFTANYDLLLETGLEEMKVPYFDGFVGTFKGQFRTELVESLPGSESMPSFVARLWKLHGSLNWEWDERHTIIRRGAPVSDSAAIYPSDTKYDESRRIPFVVLQDRFRRAMYQSETLTLVSGYSFGDQHLNEIFFDAATRKERSEIIVFCFSDIPQTLAERATITPNIQVVSGEEAIIGGFRHNWEPKGEMPESIWIDGKFTLGDFKYLAAFLARSSVESESPSNQVQPATAPLAPQSGGQESSKNA